MRGKGGEGTHNMLTMPQLTPQPSADFDTKLFVRRIREYSEGHPGKLRILEAGCGRRWNLDLAGVDFHLTGVDANAESLRIRVDEAGDLDEAIAGDLRTVELPLRGFDIVFSSFVLEHVAGAEQVLDRLVEALVPNGLLLLRIPDRASVYSFITRHSPHWIHVQYKRRVRGIKQAGTLGRGPFPTVYDPVVSWDGITDYIARHSLELIDSYSSNSHLNFFGKRAPLVNRGLHAVAAVSLGRLTADHANLALVIRKPAASRG
jgi:SAM-dependent methyltransferase